MLLFIHLLLFSFVTSIIKKSDAQCNDYYTLNPTRVNYTTWTEVTAYTNGNNIPIHVCNGAVIYPNETIPIITNDTTIMGDTQPNGIPAVWTIMTQQSPVFHISGLMTMSLQNINIFFLGTLFYVDIHSTLLFDNANTWDGNISVYISGSEGYGMGFYATQSSFNYVGVGVRYTQGSFYCTNCIFVAARYAGVLSPDRTTDGMTFYSHFYINTLFPIATLVGNDIANPNLQLIIPSNEFILSTGMYIARTYPDYTPPVIRNCSGVVGSASGQNTVYKYSETNTIIAWVIFGLMIGILIGMFAKFMYDRNRSYPQQFD
jgi:hypothetical protein